MMIKVEREALLRLLAADPVLPPSLSSSTTTTSDCHEEYEYISIQKPAFLDPTGASPQDDDSVFTSSTASLSLDSDDEPCEEKRVSFADALVTEEWTRDYTKKDEIGQLYYSTEETQRFRQEYRLERKLLSDLSIDPNDCATDTEVFSKLVDGKMQPQGRHQISRVVVLHNQKLETFVDNLEDAPSKETEATSSDDFFDSDSFWSGSITWF